MSDDAAAECAGIRRRLEAVPVGTITLVMIKLGYRHCYLRGLRPITAACRFVGRARTLATLPFREDLAGDSQWETRSRAAHRNIIEEAGAGDVIVVAARGHLEAAVIGDLMIERARYKRAAAFITDGCVRDTRNYPADWPVFAGGVHTMTFRHAHLAMEIGVPVACGEALVMPGDLLVGDEDGVVVIPWKLADQVIEASRAEQSLDEFLKARVSAGASLHQVAPPSAELLNEYRGQRP